MMTMGGSVQNTKKLHQPGSKRKKLDHWIQCDFGDNGFHSYCEQINTDYVNEKYAQQRN